ncbi:hypothetical protein Taro_005017 [Colocasia esculenta]|uniref:UBN2 domain-containing protein n=1 Tax=Colocasia esculenta TaxID=4460 RepID=A0A843TJT9_COLES|nr:hypothetical protein [Colocasia esculenta]
MAAAWNNEDNSSEESSSDNQEDKKAHLPFMGNLDGKEFNRISACKTTKEMWDKLRLTYKGKDKVKETRIDILVTQYEKF